MGFVRVNSTNSRAEIVKVTSSSRMWDTEVSWYSPIATRRIYLWLWSFDHGLPIHVFKPTWPCLIIEVLVTRVKFFQSSGYFFSNQQHLHLSHNKCFSLPLRGVMASFELVKHIFLNQLTLHVHLNGFQISHRLEQCTTCQRISYHDATKHNWYLTAVICAPQTSIY